MSTPTTNEGPRSQRLPLVALREAIIFPELIVPIGVGRPRSVAAINAASQASPPLVMLVAQKDASVDDVGERDLFHMGTIAEVQRLIRMPDGSVQVIVRGLARAQIDQFVDNDAYIIVDVSVVEDIHADREEEEAALAESLSALFEAYLERDGSVSSPEIAMAVRAAERPALVADLVAAGCTELTLEQRQQLIETPRVDQRLRILSSFLAKQIEIQELKAKIRSEVQETIDKGQRDYILREQMRVIQKELGDDDDEAEELRAKIEGAGMPAEIKAKALKELDRLARIPQASPETGVVRTYIDWLVSLPWSAATADDEWDLHRAKAILDEDHYGLTKVKDRILEYMAVRKLAKGLRAPLLCFIGPPGVGKTSLGKSIARAMGRKFVRMSLGGMHDEAEIRGHRRTYIGSQPGRILQSMKTVGTSDPVFMLDEIDKVGADWRGDPSSALLEVLDPEQNNTFQDHYLEVPYDLSKVVFITTANVEDSIVGPLRDRMEIIRLPGYTEQEKLAICTGYLVPRQLREHGLAGEGDAAARLGFTETALVDIIRRYTREAGVRSLEREIATVCRKIARRYAEGATDPVTIDAADLEEHLGPARYDHGLAEQTDMVGAATGVSVSEHGGDVLTVECTTIQGKAGREGDDLLLTGQLGKVMEESARAALSYVRAHMSELGIPADLFDTRSVHVHVPAGGIPKDGPSAGITMATAITSALTGRSVRREVAMTGEITLRGRVLPIGGVKEKLLAAHRAGIKTFVMPRQNAKDLVDVPAEVREAVTIELVEDISRVLEIALQPSQKAN